MYDVLNNLSEKRINCLDKGFVELVDVMPRLVPEETKTADFAIVQAARVSYGNGTKTVNEDRGLIRYLMRHQHTTPFEMVEFKFHCKIPIVVARQWIRHRTANVNEASGRYSILEDDFYYPNEDNTRQQSRTNKQGGDEKVDKNIADNFINSLQNVSINTYKEYEKYLDLGISREQARMILPINLYTSWYWKIDLFNLFHFLGLRCDSHAQWEIRVFAEAMLKLITPIIPVAAEAWNDYHHMRGAVKLSKLEMESLQNSLKGCKVKELKTDNKREQQEWLDKIGKLGLSIEQENK